MCLCVVDTIKGAFGKVKYNANDYNGIACRKSNRHQLAASFESTKAKNGNEIAENGIIIKRNRLKEEKQSVIKKKNGYLSYTPLYSPSIFLLICISVGWMEGCLRAQILVAD